MKSITINTRVNEATKKTFDRLCEIYNMEPADMIRFMISQFQGQKEILDYHKAVIQKIDNLYDEIAKRDKTIEKLLTLLAKKDEGSKEPKDSDRT